MGGRRKGFQKMNWEGLFVEGERERDKATAEVRDCRPRRKRDTERAGDVYCCQPLLLTSGY